GPVQSRRLAPTVGASRRTGRDSCDFQKIRGILPRAIMARTASLLFPPFRLDLGGERLWRNRNAIALRPKTFAVPRYLAERPGQLATKDELLDAVWGAGTAVSDTVLKGCIRELREALTDDARTPRFLETVHGRGYRFTGAVREASEPTANAAMPASG